MTGKMILYQGLKYVFGELVGLFRILVRVIDRSNDHPPVIDLRDFFFEDVNNVPLYIDDFFKGRVTVETSEFTVLIGVDAVVPMKEGVFPGYFLDDTVAVDEFIFHVTSPLER
jgi:hypothetical protein